MSGNYADKNGKGKGTGKVIPLWKKNTRDISPIDWGQCDLSYVRGLVDAVTRGGGAVMFGRTSDGGALSLCILQDNEKIKEYPHSVEEAEELMQEIMQHYKDNVL